MTMDSDAPPLAYIGASGKAAGLLVDIWQLWAQRTQREVRFLPANTQEALAAIASGRADIHAALAPTQELRDRFDFAPAIYETGIHLYSPVGHGPKATPQGLGGWDVGVIANSPTGSHLQQKIPDARIIFFGSPEQMILAAHEGRIGAFAGPAPVMDSRLTALGLSADFNVSPSAIIRSMLHPAIPHATPHLSALVRKGFQSISHAELAEIEARWIKDTSLRHFRPRRDDLGLTEHEKKWLAVHPVIRMAVAPDDRPLGFIDDGEFRGITHDILALIATRLGIRFESVPAATPTDAIEHDLADMRVATDTSATGGERLLPSAPFLRLPGVVIVREGQRDITAMDSLTDRLIAITGDSPMLRQLLSRHPDLRYIPTPDARAALELVASGAADAMFASMPHASHDLSKPGVTNLRTAFTTDFNEEYRFAIRNDWPELPAIIDKAIISIKEREITAIREKWINIHSTWTPSPMLLAAMGCVAAGLLLSVYWNGRLSREVAQRTKTEESLRRMAEADQLVSRVSLLMIENDFATAISEALPHIGRHLRADHCRLVEFKPDGESLSVTHEWCAGNIPPARQALEGKHISLFPTLAMAFADGQPQDIRDTSAFALASPQQTELVERHGVRSILHVPLIFSGKPIGGISVDSGRSAPPWGEEGQPLLSRVAEILIMASTRSTAEHALRETGERYRNATKAAAEGMWDWNLETGEAYTSPSFWNSLGYDTTSVPARAEDWVAFVHPADRGRLASSMRDPRQHGNTFEIAYRIRNAQGEFRWILSRGQTVEHADDGRPLRATGTHVDITAQKQAERDLRLAQTSLENSQDGILWVRQDGTHIFANDSMARLLDFDQQELLALTVGDVHPELAQRPWTETWASLERQAPAIFETLAKTRTGLVFPVEISTTFICLDEQNFLCLSVRDISERKHAEQALTQSERRFRALYEHASDGIILHDKNASVIEGNPSARELLGYDAEEFGGQTPSLLFTPQDADRFTQGVIGIANGETWRTELDMLRKDGSSFPAELSCRLVDRNIVQVILRDMSERRSMERDLVRMRDEANAANRAKTVFMTNMSHEIRTPLNGVIGMTELLANTHLTHRQREYVSGIRQSGDALLAIITDILDFARIENGNIEFETIPFSLRDSIFDILHPHSFEAARKGLHFVIRIDENVPDMLLGDRARLGQILGNIASNAVKFTEEGEISVAASMTEESPTSAIIVFAVSDTGIGIDSDKREAIFKSFEQADGSTTRRYGGTGLGLTIAAELVRQMGGAITVESAHTQGSTFTFTIEFAKSPIPLPPPTPGSQITLRGRRGLIVDGGRASRKYLRTSLEQLGIRPIVATTGKEALDLLQTSFERNERIDAVLADRDLPDLSGASFARSLRRLPHYANIPLIVLSSTDEPQDLLALRRHGVTDIIAKPVLADQLRRSLVRAMAEPTAPPMLNGHPDSAKPRILLVEDMEINRNVAVNMLRTFGLDASVATNGKQAVELYENEDFDVILMDVQMPVMDGLEATGRIREHDAKRERHVPIVAMTAHATDEDRSTILAAGMDDFIAKPFRPHELFEALRRNINIAQRLAPAQAQGAASHNAQRVTDGYVLDTDRLAMSFGGNGDFLKENVDLFLNDAAQKLTHLEERLKADDAPALAKHAHAFKGTIGYFDEGEVFMAAARLENAARDEDMRTARQALDELRLRVEHLTRALGSLF
ncbi:PAS domain S-box-containing protein [Desulfobaculum xiamenense]|uniref:Sensory/regulatory protein RpfC n=2 Tax=Desulfobaculum xiamenense TaxID=995050 RepID=A0A846QCS9_9BACT|nr:PAS domain S-box-containing protein [Desulfobaculum xiamenense]